MTTQTITTVTVPAASYDLTDLATVHDELSINTTDTSNDGFLQRAITQASSVISSYCNRVFQVETLTDLFYLERNSSLFVRPRDPQPLQLSRWPVVAVSSVTQIQQDGSTKTLTQGVDFKLNASLGWLIRLDSSSGQPTAWEWLSTTVSFKAGFTKPIVNEAVSIPIAPGPYTITVAKAANFVLDNGVLYAGSLLPLTAVASSPAVGQYSVSAAGVYTFNAAEAAIAVLLSYLYSSIPDDLVDACLRLVTARFKSRGRDPYLRSQGENIGQQQYWVGPMIGQNGALPPEIQAIADNYRVPLVA